MVNWKANESTDRLIAVLIAAHPGLKLEYQAMATLFGQGATYDAIEGRFRRYRKMADEVKADALSRGITELPRGRNGTTGSASSSVTPRTPRGPRGGITKPSSSTGRSRKSTISQGRGGGGNNSDGMSFMEAIFLDDGLSEEDKKVKSEAAEILTGLGGNSAVVHDLTGASTPTASSASIASMKMEDAAESFSSPFGGDVKQEGRGIGHVAGGGIDVSAIEHDEFDMAGLYFHGHGGYDMDDIYGGAA
ncbi:uncharacterized protein P174DRAFT_464158 [Aspergillus novofumigatus IBT 16806]|uniref:Uncharacterized protein n=1 Tax=Aspergillus novofumigatus (strain IBT 16806) TaxID=1392255 RepID=A0A2I1BWS1_ASPN1|nr:uncharacterized protein P174DRAFT_464158 [Aspergillus novofumigatus IBT 16806]PKX89751.1 hypothetical protein P174DRAFT_464158 [Aspergillus novofumigatus IBT 16806]